MEDRGAIVVGGAGGIGGAICRDLASRGYRVTVVDRDEAGGKAVLGALPGAGHAFAAVDILDEASIAEAFDSIEARHPAAVLVVAAGGPVVSLDRRVDSLSMTKSDFEKTFALNVSGVFSCIKKFAQQRSAAPLDGGRIVVIGSSAGEIAGTGTDIGYVTAKAAVLGMVRQLAFDLAPAKVTVNTVAAGPVETPEFVRRTNEQIRAGIASFTLLKRLAVPEEVSAAVGYLVSRDAGYITGTTLDINGGVHMH